LDVIVIGGFIGALVVAWALRSRRTVELDEAERRRRQRARLLGQAPIPGSDGKFEPREDD